MAWDDMTLTWHSLWYNLHLPLPQSWKTYRIRIHVNHLWEGPPSYEMKGGSVVDEPCHVDISWAKVQHIHRYTLDPPPTSDQIVDRSQERTKNVCVVVALRILKDLCWKSISLGFVGAYWRWCILYTNILTILTIIKVWINCHSPYHITTTRLLLTILICLQLAYLPLSLNGFHQGAEVTRSKPIPVSICRLGSSVKRPSSPRKNCMKTRFLHQYQKNIIRIFQFKSNHQLKKKTRNSNSQDLGVRHGHPKSFTTLLTPQLPTVLVNKVPDLDDIWIVCIHQCWSITPADSIIVQFWARSTRACAFKTSQGSQTNPKRPWAFSILDHLLYHHSQLLAASWSIS